MTRGVVAGLLVDELGLASSTSLVQGPRRPELLRRHYARPAGEYRSTQAARIPLDVRHGREVGRVVHLEHVAGSGLWAVAEVDELEAVPESCAYYSPATLGTPDGRDVELRTVALTDEPGSCSPRPVRRLAGDLRTLRRDRTRHLVGDHLAAMLERARAGDGTTWIHGRTRSAPVPVEYADPPVNVVADRAARMFILDVGAVTLRDRARLVWRGDNPVGIRAPELEPSGTTRRVFKALRTADARNALELVADGVLDRARPWRRADGTVGAVELTAAG